MFAPLEDHILSLTAPSWIVLMIPCKFVDFVKAELCGLIRSCLSNDGDALVVFSWRKGSSSVHDNAMLSTSRTAG